jgi:hypothetical protein
MTDIYLSFDAFERGRWILKGKQNSWFSRSSYDYARHFSHSLESNRVPAEIQW